VCCHHRVPLRNCYDRVDRCFFKLDRRGGSQLPKVYDSGVGNSFHRTDAVTNYRRRARALRPVHTSDLSSHAADGWLQLLRLTFLAWDIERMRANRAMRILRAMR
jgi:hypothetical protein